MGVSTQEIITNLVNGFGLSKEGLADKMGVTTMTITRWGNGDYKPNKASLKLLNAIYRGYKNTRKGKK